MLDTDICIYSINRKPASYLRKLETLERIHDLKISSITLAELQYGIALSIRKEQNQNNLDIFLSKIEVMDFSAKCAFHYGELRAWLKKKAVPIGANDLFIASHALTEGATLVTNNIKEFNRIPGLTVENWD